MSELRFDWQRRDRTGVSEAVFAQGKSPQQLRTLIADARQRHRSLLFTRLSPEQGHALCGEAGADFHYDPDSGSAILDLGLEAPEACSGLIVTAGTSDLPIAREAQQTLRFHGLDVPILADCGVAGLWRLTEQAQRLQAAKLIIAVAGMEGALFPVIAGLTPALVIAVPTSIGYGVAEGGKGALSSALATCAPGIVTVNIDNGFGAACAAVKILRARPPDAPDAD